MVYILLADGFEEVEALTLCDVLRRGGVETALCTVGDIRVTGGHGIVVEADGRLQDIDLAHAEMLAVPGGMGGVRNLLANAQALAILTAAWERGVLLAAICAGPAVLAKLGLTAGREITAYPGMDEMMGGAKVLDKNVAVGEGFLTGKGPGAAFDFALAALETLRGRERADEVAKGLCYDRS